MQIQCPKCNNWTDSEANVCQAYGNHLDNNTSQMDAFTDDPDVQQKSIDETAKITILLFFVILIIGFILSAIINLIL